MSKPEEGLKEVRYVDPLKIRYVRKLKKTKEDNLSGITRAIAKQDNSFTNPEIEEYYLYNPNGALKGGGATYSASNADSKAVKIAPDSIRLLLLVLLIETSKQFFHISIKQSNLSINFV